MMAESPLSVRLAALDERRWAFLWKYVELLCEAAQERAKGANHALWALMLVISFTVYVLYLPPSRTESQAVPFLGMTAGREELFLVLPLLAFAAYWFYIYLEYRCTRTYALIDALFGSVLGQETIDLLPLGDVNLEYFTESHPDVLMSSLRRRIQNRVLYAFQYPIALTVVFVPLILQCLLLLRIDSAHDIGSIIEPGSVELGMRLILALDAFTLPAMAILVVARFFVSPMFSTQVVESTAYIQDRLFLSEVPEVTNLTEHPSRVPADPTPPADSRMIDGSSMTSGGSVLQNILASFIEVKGYFFRLVVDQDLQQDQLERGASPSPDLLKARRLAVAGILLGVLASSILIPLALVMGPAAVWMGLEARRSLVHLGSSDGRFIGSCAVVSGVFGILMFFIWIAVFR